MRKQSKSIDLIYVEGSGDIVGALELWHSKKHMLSEMAITYSSQVFEFCNRNKLKTLAISTYRVSKKTSINNFEASSAPKKSFSGSFGYHLSQIIYGLKLLTLCIKKRPKYLHIPNGATHWFMLAPLYLFDIKIIPRFHNTLWPDGYYPQSKFKQLILRTDAWFLRNIASSSMGVSEKVTEQINYITSNSSCKNYVFVPQFNSECFVPSNIDNFSREETFQVLYSGRLEHFKGVFDILEMAKKLGDKQVQFHICGYGSDEQALRKKCQELSLESKVTIHGQLEQPKLIEMYQKSHVIIIPTRSDFEEGFAKVAAEAILLNKPIITSPVVPAMHSLKEATAVAITDDIDSYVSRIEELMNNPEKYKELVHACNKLKKQFFNPKLGIGYVMEKTL